MNDIDRIREQIKQMRRKGIEPDYPGNYEVKQVYSSVGAIAEKTIVSANDRAFFLSKDGLYYYNGVSA